MGAERRFCPQWLEFDGRRGYTYRGLLGEDEVSGSVTAEWDKSNKSVTIVFHGGFSATIETDERGFLEMFMPSQAEAILGTSGAPTSISAGTTQNQVSEKKTTVSEFSEVMGTLSKCKCSDSRGTSCSRDDCDVAEECYAADNKSCKYYLSLVP